MCRRSLRRPASCKSGSCPSGARSLTTSGRMKPWAGKCPPSLQAIAAAAAGPARLQVSRPLAQTKCRRERRRIHARGQVYQAGRAFSGQIIALEPLGGLQHRMWFREIDLGPVELAPPRRMIDSAVEALLERPFRKSHRVKPMPRSDSANQPEVPAIPLRRHFTTCQSPRAPPQLPNEPCYQQT